MVASVLEFNLGLMITILGRLAGHCPLLIVSEHSTGYHRNACLAQKPRQPSSSALYLFRILLWWPGLHYTPPVVVVVVASIA